MEIVKIANKYCTNEKVQVMFSNAKSQIICSKDGYLYLRNGPLTFHPYLTDPIRNKMPYRNNPSSENHATHLFKYGQLYAKFTRSRDMRGGYPFNDSYCLTFLYFIKIENGEAILAEIWPHEFEKEKETTKFVSKEELENFLYDLNSEEADAKCIFQYFNGIEYVKHTNEQVSIFNDNFLKLSDKDIIEKYNIMQQPMASLFNPELRKKQQADESWKAHSIDDIKDFVLTYHGSLTSQFSPLLLVIKGDEMYFYEFKITFCEEDCYELKTTKTKISLNYNDIITRAYNCGYTSDPTFTERF